MSLNKKMLVHALDKSKARIILAFFFAGCALDLHEVMEWTGLSRPTASTGLQELKGMGLLGTQALAHNRTLWLPAGDMLDLQMQKSFTSGPSSRGSSVNELNNINSKLLQPLNSQMSKNFTSGNAGEVIVIEEVPADPAILKALDDAKIREPKRSMLARLEHVTVELIQGHVATAPNKALAIYRIEHDWELPEARKGNTFVVDKGKRGVEVVTVEFDYIGEIAAFTGHERDCNCMDCTMARTVFSTNILCPTCKHHRCECEAQNE
jgi:hypothetical protein